ncbi:hypothetical protein BD779DRAFT_1681042 [Infundibulicybe gibba]|nr:hypothetical protein BD779DRAFT_1681042 [Infundibulicybe gibba]
MALTHSAATALGVVFDAILYGAYMALFVLYLILWHRNNRVVGRPLVLAQIFLFSLCTLSLCLEILWGYFSIVPGVENLKIADKFDTSTLTIYVIIDYLAQMILATKLYRCWIVWDRRWVIVAVPGFLALVTLGGGVALVALRNSPLWATDVEKIKHRYGPVGTTTYTTSLVVNALTTSLIVTKIFLTSREVRSVLGSNSHQSLLVATAMLVESGLLIFTFQLVHIVLFSAHSATNMISGATTQIYGIAPTLLNIRVVMGSTYDKTTEKALSLRFARSRAATQTTGQIMSAAGVQSRGIITELDDASSNERDLGDLIFASPGTGVLADVLAKERVIEPASS